MEAIIKNYKERMEDLLFNGYEIKQLENSLYTVHSDKILIVSGQPKTEHYLFTMHPRYLEIVKEVVFLCANDQCAFKLPSRLLKGLPFSTKGNGRPKTKIDFDERTLTWYLTFNKDEYGNTQMDLSNFFFDLRTDEDIIATSILIRKTTSNKGLNSSLLFKGGTYLSLGG